MLSTGTGEPASLDAASRQWVEQLRDGHPRHDQAVAALHDLLRGVAVRELVRRRDQLRTIAGPEFDDLAQQVADDAVVGVLGRLDDFRGLSRFTTWAYKFVVFEISAHLARHRRHRQQPRAEVLAWDEMLDPLARRPEETLEQRAQLGVLSSSIRELTTRQREVFVAIALNEVPIDIVALRLGSNRNSIYKNLFDARRTLRAKMAASGHPVGDPAVGKRPAARRARVLAGSSR